MIRPDVYAAITDNDLSSVIFVDPFLPVTRQAKRNLLAASFVALLIAVLDLEITGFLGLSATNSNLGNALAQGLACLVVIYFLVTLMVHLFVDYNAWQFHRERQETEPYLELIRLLESQVSALGEQIKNACEPLRAIEADDDMRSQIDAQKQVKSTIGQVQSISRNVTSLIEEVAPLVESWRGSIEDMSRLNARLWVRIAGLWVLDIIFPIFLAATAIWITGNSVIGVFERVAG